MNGGPDPSPECKFAKDDSSSVAAATVSLSLLKPRRKVRGLLGEVVQKTACLPVPHCSHDQCFSRLFLEPF